MLASVNFTNPRVPKYTALSTIVCLLLPEDIVCARKDYKRELACTTRGGEL